MSTVYKGNVIGSSKKEGLFAKLSDEGTDLKKLKFKDFLNDVSNAPYVEHDINTGEPVERDSWWKLYVNTSELAVQRRLEDVKRISKFIASPKGILWESKRAGLETLQKGLQQQQAKRVQKIHDYAEQSEKLSFWQTVGKIGKNVLKSLGQTVGLTASTLEQTGVSGTGVRVNTYISRAYLNDGSDKTGILNTILSYAGITDGGKLNGGAAASLGASNILGEAPYEKLDDEKSMIPKKAIGGYAKENAPQVYGTQHTSTIGRDIDDGPHWDKHGEVFEEATRYVEEIVPGDDNFIKNYLNENVRRTGSLAPDNALHGVTEVTRSSLVRNSVSESTIRADLESLAKADKYGKIKEIAVESKTARDGKHDATVVAKDAESADKFYWSGSYGGDNNEGKEWIVTQKPKDPTIGPAVDSKIRDRDIRLLGGEENGTYGNFKDETKASKTLTEPVAKTKEAEEERYETSSILRGKGVQDKYKNLSYNRGQESRSLSIQSRDEEVLGSFFGKTKSEPVERVTGSLGTADEPGGKNISSFFDDDSHTYDVKVNTIKDRLGPNIFNKNSDVWKSHYVTYSLNQLEYQTGSVAEDLGLIPFCITTITPDYRTYLNFPAYLDSYDDNYTGEWESVKYVGRAENFYGYKGFSRSINLGFKVVAFRRRELEPLYRQLNKLVGATAPSYQSSLFMRGTLASLTIGDLLQDQMGFIPSIKLSWDKDDPWEITAGLRVPHVLTVTMTFTPIEKQEVREDYGAYFVSEEFMPQVEGRQTEIPESTITKLTSKEEEAKTKAEEKSDPVVEHIEQRKQETRNAYQIPKPQGIQKVQENPDDPILQNLQKKQEQANRFLIY